MLRRAEVALTLVAVAQAGPAGLRRQAGDASASDAHAESSGNTSPAFASGNTSEIGLMLAASASSSSYVLGTKSSLSCPGGFARIKSRWTCEQAARALGLRFTSEEKENTYPSGCYAHEGGTVYFNTDATDRAHSASSLLCEKPKVKDWPAFCRAQACNEWSHESPQCWWMNAQRCYWSCHGERQSPILIKSWDTKPGDFESLRAKMKYPPLQHMKVKNTGHSLYVHAAPGHDGAFLGPEQRWYQLHGWYVQTPSEHEVEYTQGGAAVAAAELRVVHLNQATWEKLILVIRLEEGGPNHELLSQMGLPHDAPKSQDADMNIVGAVTLLDTLAVFEKGYFYYEGSSTTPPCTEDVHWYIAAELVKVSIAQLDALRSLIHMTPREIEKVHERILTKHMPR